MCSHPHNRFESSLVDLTVLYLRNDHTTQHPYIHRSTNRFFTPPYINLNISPRRSGVLNTPNITPIPSSQGLFQTFSTANLLKAVFHCSRIPNVFQLLLYWSNLGVFCLILRARTRLEVELHSTFFACSRYSYLFFHKIKNSSLPARAMWLQWKNSLNALESLATQWKSLPHHHNNQQIFIADAIFDFIKSKSLFTYNLT
jgi:hypothetical protein